MASKFRTYLLLLLLLLLLQVTSQATSLSTAQPPTSGDSGCSPGTVCRHGYCPADSLSCLCHSGWAGFYCEEPCPPGCEQRGACQTNPEGKAICWCEPGYGYINGSGCVYVTTTPKTRSNRENTVTTEYSDSPPAVTTVAAASVLRPSNTGLEQCVPGLPCFHGTCQTAPNIACVCHKGWEGVFCQNQCPLECGPHGRCQRVAGEDSAMFCDCVHGYEGDLCDKMTIDRTDEIANLSDKPSDMLVTLKSLSDRQCAVGFVCVHGYCTSEGLECVCDPGYVGVFCHELCPAACVHGECLLFPNNTVYCSCDVHYTGANCTEIRTVSRGEVEMTWYWYVGGASATVLLVLVLALVVLPYYMWRRGHLLMMKILYHFQSYEDDDDKMFDAFVSYRSSGSDEHFVMTHLVPKLERGLNFRLCVHFRDFIPGETIANNIITAVENSRRTILILTPEFIRSDFCRFEYQRAQLQMMKRKQRIIPLVLRDISREKKNMDESLRSILDTITYLDWPQNNDPNKIEKFWKRLELSMPKKKSTGSDYSPGTRSATNSLASRSSLFSYGGFPTRPAFFGPLSLAGFADNCEGQENLASARNGV